MEDPAKRETAKGSARKKSSRAVKKGGRKTAAARSDERSPPNQLIGRGRSLVRTAEKWAGGAARIASPLADASANAMVMGILGLGVGVALGAMMPRMSMSEMMPAGVTGRTSKRSKRRGRASR